MHDVLVLSPGAAPIRPELPGIDLPGVFSVRSIPDTREIRGWITHKSARQAVVAGGGFIGLEMAENLRHLGLDVALLEELVGELARVAARIPSAHEGARRAAALLDEARLYLAAATKAQDKAAPGADPAAGLTERETEILRYVAKGLTAKQIAERLTLSHRTVENHVQATFRKLQVANRVEAARYAIEHGLD